MSRILVVEDEPAIALALQTDLRLEGYEVEVAEDGETASQRARNEPFDLILLDIMLPGMNGFDICDEIRKVDRDQPIIMLTAKASDEDIVHGLRLGADDYVAKPFSVEQLVLRVGAVLRRTKIQAELASEITIGDLTIDARNLSGRRAGRKHDDEIVFTRREMEILQFLAANSERPVSREELLTQVWGYAKNLDIETRTVDIHIAKLRRKIEADAKAPAHLITVRGAGYRLLES